MSTDSLVNDIAGRRLTRERSCDGKRGYRTKEYADGVARNSKRKYGQRQRVYFCVFCTQYHLTTEKAAA